jgi:hypothetical protein
MKLAWRDILGGGGAAVIIYGLWAWNQTQDFPNTNLKNLLLGYDVQLKLYCMKFHVFFMLMIILQSEMPH